MLGKLRTGSLVLLLLISLALTPFRPLKISGRSMEPTLRNGETYLLDHLYWRRGGVRRGDIVVVRHDEDKWVKRLVGMPDDELQIFYGPRGWIFRIDNLTTHPGARRPDEPTARIRKVGPNEIFVIGDNLNRSQDSTNQEVGAFLFEDIVGVVRSFRFSRDFEFRTHK